MILIHALGVLIQWAAIIIIIIIIIITIIIIIIIIIIITYSMVQSPSSEANWFATSQEIPRIFMEPEGSLPHSQASANSPYPGPAQSSPHTHIPPPGNPS